MKKFLAIFLVLTLLFSFAACNKEGNGDEGTTTVEQSERDEQPSKGGDKSEHTTKKREEKTTAAPFVDPVITEPAKLFSLVNVNDYDHKESTPNTTASSGVTFIMNRYTLKNNNSNTIPDAVTVGSFDFVLGETTVSDALANGWSLIGKIDVNTAVEAGDEKGIILQSSDGKILRIGTMNKTANTVAITDCVIVEVCVTKSVENKFGWVDFNLGDNVSTDATYEEAVKNLGKPQTINVVEYYKGNDFTRSTVTLLFEKKSGDTTYMVSIGYKDENGKAVLENFVVTAK
jgi:hypothetical protein